MPDSNWSVRFAVIGALALLTFTALGAGAFFGALNAPHYGYQTAHPTNRSVDLRQRHRSQIDRGRSGLPYLAQRLASGSDPEDAEERENRNLAAQEATSVWAFWMLLVSSVGVATTMIGTGFLLWQIVLTRKAVEDTTAATEAMRVSNQIAQDASRGWAVCERIVLREPVRFFDHPGFGLRYEMHTSVVLKNTGSTLLTSVRLDMVIGGMTPEIWENHPREAEARFAAMTEPWMGVTLAPGQSISLQWGWGGPSPGTPTLEALHGGAFMLKGYISYRDHFGRKQFTRFAFHPDGDSVRQWDHLTLVQAGGYGDAS